MKLWYIVVLVMSSVGFIIMGIDKGKARKQNGEFLKTLYGSLRY